MLHIDTDSGTDITANANVDRAKDAPNLFTVGTTVSDLLDMIGPALKHVSGRSHVDKVILFSCIGTLQTTIVAYKLASVGSKTES